MLASHHAAIYAYPVVGVQLDGPGQIATVRSLIQAHQSTRDLLMKQLAARSATPVSASPTYSPAEPVTTTVTAERWALQLEQDCAAAYRYLLVGTVKATGPVAALRRQALTGLATAAQNSLRWRRLLTPATPTVPFPGV